MIKNKQKQSGFTLVETLAVIGVISVLALGVYWLTQYVNEKINTNTAQTQLQSYFTESVMECNKYYRTLSGCDAERIQQLSPFDSTDTAWGDTWSVADAANEIVVTYPFDGSNDAANKCNHFAALLNNMSKISASCSDTTLSVTYKR